MKLKTVIIGIGSENNENFPLEMFIEVQGVFIAPSFLLWKEILK